MIPPPDYPRPWPGDFTFVDGGRTDGGNPWIQLCYRPLGVVVVTDWCQWYEFSAGHVAAVSAMMQKVWVAQQVSLSKKEEMGWHVVSSPDRADVCAALARLHASRKGS